MTTLILALPTPQQRADEALRWWQEQRKAGIKPDQRQIPDDAFSQNLAPIKEALERTR